MQLHTVLVYLQKFIIKSWHGWSIFVRAHQNKSQHKSQIAHKHEINFRMLADELNLEKGPGKRIKIPTVIFNEGKWVHFKQHFQNITLLLNTDLCLH